MKVKLVSIGNSKGVRIPRAVIRECGLGEQIDLRVKDGAVVLAPMRSVRDGWDVAFAKAIKSKNDAPLMPDSMTHSWDEEEWEW